MSLDFLAFDHSIQIIRAYTISYIASMSMSIGQGLLAIIEQSMKREINVEITNDNECILLSTRPSKPTTIRI